MTEELTADLVELRKIGEYPIPDIAEDFLATANALANVSYSASGLFTSPASGGAESRVRREWLALFELTQNAAATTCTNLRDIGIGIVNAANSFASDDDNSGTTLDALNAEMEIYEHGDPDRNMGSNEKPGPVDDPDVVDVPDDEVAKIIPPGEYM
ncbi:MAG TPA: hypothetical protein H9881_04320 [Candidatus Stackebrandtia excrementipullorum]|nr:hypothetical protein [Candidatus Stackebrandtia excrementipullorum]